MSFSLGLPLPHGPCTSPKPGESSLRVPSLIQREHQFLLMEDTQVAILRLVNDSQREGGDITTHAISQS